VPEENFFVPDLLILPRRRIRRNRRKQVDESAENFNTFLTEILTWKDRGLSRDQISARFSSIRILVERVCKRCAVRRAFAIVAIFDANLKIAFLVDK
jgi:hypothetical protein